MKPDSVLARLAASWGVAAAAAPASADVAALQSEFDAFKAKAEADMSEVQTALQSAVALAQEMEASATAANEKLAALEAERQAAEAQAAADKVVARESKLKAILGDARADSVIAATAGMNDEAFEAVVAAMSAAQATEASSPLFNEVGASAEVDASTAAEQPSAEMQILRRLYGNKA